MTATIRTVFALSALLVLVACGGGGSSDAAPGAGATNRAPQAAFDAIPGTGAAHLEVRFDASASTDPDGTITSFRWAFGDGSEAVGRTVTHRYAAPGDYLVRLTVTDGRRRQHGDDVHRHRKRPPRGQRDGRRTARSGAAGGHLRRHRLDRC